MTNDELNKAIVELTGGCVHEWDNRGVDPTGVWYCKKCPRKQGKRYQKIPDYCSSRDLCAELIISEGLGFESKLQDKLEIVNSTEIMTAKPRLWAEAIYETLKE